MIFNASNLCKKFSGETLFENVSFNIYENDKIGLIGVNGSGKSTLFKTLIGEEDLDEGTIGKNKTTNLGYLDQHLNINGDKTIMEVLLSAFEDVINLEEELNKVHLDIQNRNGDLDTLIKKQSILQEKFLKLDGAFYKSKIKGMLLGLGFKEEEFDIEINKLSGGQRTRVALCKVLLSNANLLLLDEPTNHLDIESIEWLEDFLSSYKGSFIVVSHDRYFLDKVTNKTFELDNKHLNIYKGNYSAYVTQKEVERLTKERNYNYTIGEIKRLEKVVEQQRRWKHKKNKKTHTIDNTKKAIERLENNLVIPDKPTSVMNFKFKSLPCITSNILIGENLSKSFDDKTLFKNINLQIKKKEIVFLLGANGSGKTTLLKIFMQQLKPTTGVFKLGENVEVAYYDQLKESLHKEKTIIEEISDEYPFMTRTEVRNALATFLFKGDDVFKEIGLLSGGETSRVLLTKLLLKPANLLIMDEPTNHLDIASREALESALIDYDGTMFLVSHDRYFINRLADRILYLTFDGIKEFDGDYDDFLKESRMPVEEIKPVKKDQEYKQQKKVEAEKRKLINKSTELEEQIEQIENKIQELINKCSDPEIEADYIKLAQISNEIDSLRADEEEYMKEWEKLQLLIDEF